MKFNFKNHIFGLFLVFCFFILAISVFQSSYSTFNILYLKIIFFVCILLCSFILILIFKNSLILVEKLSSKHILLILITLVFISRGLWILVNNVLPMSDFNTYHIFAQSMSKGKIIGEGYISIYPNYFNYPLVLSYLYKFFGTNVIVAQLFNVVLSFGISILIFFIAKKEFNKTVGFYSSIIWIFWPSQILYSVLVCTEYIFTFMLLVTIYAFLKIYDYYLKNESKYLVFVIVGILISITNAFRPLGLIILATLSLFILLFNYKYNKNIILKNIVIISIIFLSFFSTSSLISMLITKSINQSIASSPYGYNLYVGLNIESNGAWNIKDSNEISVIRNKVGFLKPQEIHDEFMKLAISRIKNTNFHQFRHLIFEKFKTMWSADSEIIHYISMAIDKENKGIFNFYKYQKLLTKITNAYYYMILTVIIFGSLRYKKIIERRFIFISCIFIFGVASTHLIVEVATRYHFPTIVFFSIIVSNSLWHLSNIEKTIK